MGEVITFEEVKVKVIKKYLDLLLEHMLDDLTPLAKISKNEDAVKYVESKLPETKGFSFEIKMSIFVNALALVDTLHM